MALIGQVVSEEKIFKKGGRTDDTDGRTDGCRLDGHTITSLLATNFNDQHTGYNLPFAHRLDRQNTETKF